MINRVTITAMLHVFAVTEFPSTHLLTEKVQDFSNEIYILPKPELIIKTKDLDNKLKPDLKKKIERTFKSYPVIKAPHLSKPIINNLKKMRLWATWFYV